MLPLNYVYKSTGNNHVKRLVLGLKLVYQAECLYCRTKRCCFIVAVSMRSWLVWEPIRNDLLWEDMEVKVVDWAEGAHWIVAKCPFPFQTGQKSEPDLKQLSWTYILRQNPCFLRDQQRMSFTQGWSIRHDVAFFCVNSVPVREKRLVFRLGKVKFRRVDWLQERAVTMILGGILILDPVLAVNESELIPVFCLQIFSFKV